MSPAGSVEVSREALAALYTIFDKVWNDYTTYECDTPGYVMVTTQDDEGLTTSCDLFDEFWRAEIEKALGIEGGQ